MCARRPLKKKKKTMPQPALLTGWDKKKKAAIVNDEQDPGSEEDKVIKYGGFVANDESDAVEMEAATNKKGMKRAKDEGLKMVKIMANPVALKTLVEARQGARNWSLKHLPADAKEDFEVHVASCMRMKAGSLSPWKSLSVSDIQMIIDDVYGEGKHKVTATGAFYGLMLSQLNTWCCGFVDAADTSFKELIKEHEEEELDSPETIAEYVVFYLKKTNNGETHGFEWEYIDKDGRKKGYLMSGLITRTLGNGHLTKFPETIADFSEEKHWDRILNTVRGYVNGVTGKKKEKTKATILEGVLVIEDESCHRSKFVAKDDDY
ncbi:hypothetical protein M378DRAFT_176566 [Amanita muscaria Koide BX008]|uniref:Uncharacterized protein n=1 Tax=Amanita muscaria (strain Koide BX008) TaxID=946122 RepID=A0A0C2SZR3_AMAMK|nr:hypothetical protein M378DRAFT_176566 [Amanita muscaria Koide BX008]